MSVSPLAWAFVLGLGLATVILHLVANAFDTYGIFRDEYYYLACARHLDWGFVDHPPLSIAALAVQTAVLGDNLFALRVLPALLAGVVVALVGAGARELGGGRFAQTMASLLALCVPCFRGFGSYYSMNIFDLAVWAAAVFLLARIANGHDRRLWLVLGVVLGLGLENKLSVLYLGVGIGVGMVLSPVRRHILTPWPWLAAAIAGVLVAPHLWWQVAHDWPTAEFVHNATQYKNVHLSPADFLRGVRAEGHPAYAPLWLLGIGWLLVRGGRHRWAGWLAVAVLAVLIATGSAKPYYADPVLLPLTIGAAVALEAWLRRVWLRGLAVAYIVLAGLIALPFAIPILPVDTLIAYQARLGLAPRADERSDLADLPQFYADRFGWHDLAAAVEIAYRALPSDERSKAYVFGQNYGQAASLEYLRRQYDLPPVISGHNTYWLWGYGAMSRDVLIVVGDHRERLEELFETVERAATKHCEHCMPYENDQPIWICRGLRLDRESLWRETRRFI